MLGMIGRRGLAGHGGCEKGKFLVRDRHRVGSGMATLEEEAGPGEAIGMSASLGDREPCDRYGSASGSSSRSRPSLEQNCSNFRCSPGTRFDAVTTSPPLRIAAVGALSIHQKTRHRCRPTRAHPPRPRKTRSRLRGGTDAKRFRSEYASV